MSCWMIRAGRGGVYAQEWLAHGLIGIGWNFDGADIANMTKEEIRAKYIDAHPGESKGKIGAAVTQVAKFAHDVVPGSQIVMYDPAARIYHLGKVTGPCVLCDDDAITYTRKVDWVSQAPRDSLQESSKNSLGGISTIFSVSNAVMEDLHRAAHGKKKALALGQDAEDSDSDADDEARYATFDDGIERIKDRVMAIDPYDMEQLVAGLLRAMGYHATVTGKGGDGGRDVVASPDALGLESPRIVCEVKHRKGAIGAPLLRSFIGGLRAADRGLYVSTGDFTKEARYEADRANVPVRLLNLDEFVRLYVSLYDKTDEDARAILPLVRIWWPA